MLKLKLKLKAKSNKTGKATFETIVSEVAFLLFP